MKSEKFEFADITYTLLQIILSFQSPATILLRMMIGSQMVIRSNSQIEVFAARVVAPFN